jgi:serine/threonine protein kinase
VTTVSCVVPADSVWDSPRFNIRNLGYYEAPRRWRLAETDLALVTGYDGEISRLTKALTSEWRVEDHTSGRLRWRIFGTSKLPLPRQGWKIHVSASVVEAISLCRTVLQFLVSRGCVFKAPLDIASLLQVNSGEAGATQVGKVVTVYPRELSELVALAYDLNELWPISKGPRIPSDLYCRHEGAVSLRYGAFTSIEVYVNPITGQHSPLVRLPDGSPAEDRRSLNGEQPAWVSPLPLVCSSNPYPSISEELLGRSPGVFAIAFANRSPKGNSYYGIDTRSLIPVVIKEARKGIAEDLRGNDGIERLRIEFANLTALDEVGIAPKPIELLIGDPTILVLAELAGSPLSSAPRQSRLACLPKFALALERLHSAGWVHRDVKLANALLVGDAVHLIDFEHAAPMGAMSPPLGGTFGYIPPEGSTGSAATAGDAFGLGVSIAHAVLGFDPALIPENPGRLVGLLNFHEQYAYAGVVRSLTAKDPTKRLSVGSAFQQLRDVSVSEIPPSVPAVKVVPSQRIFRAALEAGLATEIFKEIRENGCTWTNRHLNSDFCCESLNIGSAGILLGLLTLREVLKVSVFDKDIFDGARHLCYNEPAFKAPGLFTGDAGVALCLSIAARVFDRKEFLDAARKRLSFSASSSLLTMDLFSGVSGILWAGVLMAEVLSEDWPLSAIAGLAKILMENAELRNDLRVWPYGVEDGSSIMYLGAAHGSAGIGMALACWGLRVNDPGATALGLDTLRRLYERCGREIGSLPSILGEDKSISKSNWCHGSAGYLWCLLQISRSGSCLGEAVDWAVGEFVSADLTLNPVYCHGLAGQLELSRMLMAIPRHLPVGKRSALAIVEYLRLVQQRLRGLAVWGSDDPSAITPDLWVGFLGPATNMALLASGSALPLLSSSWLRQIASSRSTCSKVH